MLNCRFYLLILFFLGITQSKFFAQSDTSSKFSAVRLKARAQKDKILLRWGVDQPAAWKISNKYGFYVDRFTVYRDGKDLVTPEGVRLTATPIKPKPLNEWEKIMLTNDRAAIIAQALYGKEFGVEMPQSGNTSVIAQNDELVQRFTFSLMAADQNFEAAQWAGWGFADTTAKANELYQYRVLSAMPSKIMRIDTAAVVIGIADYSELPSPIDVNAQFGDKSVMLSWNYQIHQELYSSFFVERSEDSLNFQRVTNAPVTNFLPQGEKTPNSMFCRDSLKENDKYYWYRVRGITSFGELSPPSAAVKGMGEEFLAYAPSISDYNLLADSAVQLRWTYPQAGVKMLDYFVLSVSNDLDGVYKVVRDNIAASDSVLVVKADMPSNYYMLSAVNKKGRKYDSYAQLVQMNDTIPPSVPIGLTGSIDESGYIQLDWKANKESDFHGYHIYRCNAKGEEMSLITQTPIQETFFCDSANLNFLNKKVFYAIAALDKRYNGSKLSAIIEITKPDKNPPAPPVFAKYLSAEEKVTLFWENSPSDDVATTRLFRRLVDASYTDDKWALVKEFSIADSSVYTDENLTGGRSYAYTHIPHLSNR